MFQLQGLNSFATQKSFGGFGRNNVDHKAQHESALLSAGIPSDVIAQGKTAVEEYADANGIQLPPPPPPPPEAQGQNQESIFSQLFSQLGIEDPTQTNTSDPKAQMANDLMALGIPSNVIQQGREAVKEYADANGIELPPPPQKPEAPVAGGSDQLLQLIQNLMANLNVSTTN